MLYVIMNNPGGELDRREARDEDHAVDVLKEMLDDCGSLSHGDTFVIVDPNEE